MASARSLLATGLLMLLGFAIFAAVYWSQGRPGESARSTFTAYLTAKETETGQEYKVIVFSDIILGDDKASVQSWTLQAQIDWNEDGVDYRNIYAGSDMGNRFSGNVTNKGRGRQEQFNVVACESINQAAIVAGAEATAFTSMNAPREIVDDRRDMMVAAAKRFTWTIAESTFNLFADDDNKPKFLVNRDATFTFDKYDEGAKTWEFDVPEGGYDCPEIYKWRDYKVSSAPHVSMLEHIKAKPAVDLSARKEKLQGVCDVSHVGDGRCDAECNTVTFNNDGGDCCPGTCTQGRTYACGTGADGYLCDAPKYNPLAKMEFVEGKNYFKDGGVHIYHVGVQAGRVCGIFHGLGTKGSNTFTTGRISYWSASVINGLQGVCNAYSFAYFDTTNTPLTNGNLLRGYYNEAMRIQGLGGRNIAHSMAGDILGMACHLDSSRCSVRFIALGVPSKGSKAANFGSLISKIPGLGSLAGFGASVRSLTPGNAHLGNGALANTIRNRGLVTNGVCGVSAWGSGGGAGAGYLAVRVAAYCSSTFLGICKSWHAADGVVAEYECNGVASGWSNSWNSNFYRYDGNHGDCRGDGGNYRNIIDFLRRALG